MLLNDRSKAPLRFILFNDFDLEFMIHFSLHNTLMCNEQVVDQTLIKIYQGLLS